MWDHRGCPRTGLCTAALGWEAAWLLALGLTALLGLGLLISRQMCIQQEFSLPRCGSPRASPQALVHLPTVGRLGVAVWGGPATLPVRGGPSGLSMTGLPGPGDAVTAWDGGQPTAGLSWKSDTDPCGGGRCHRPGISAGTRLLPPPCTHRVRLVGHSMAKTPRDLVFKEGACSRLQGQHKGRECGQSCPLPPPLWLS